MGKTKPKKHQEQPNIFSYLGAEDANLLKLLKKGDNGKSISILSTHEVETIWTKTSNIINTKYINSEEDKMSDLNILQAATEIGLNVIKSEGFTSTQSYIYLLEMFISACTCLSENPASKNLFEICENWYGQHLQDVKGMPYFAVKYGLDVCLSEKPTVSWLKRLYCIKEKVNDISPEQWGSVKRLFISAVKSDSFVNIEQGWKFLAYLFKLDENNTKDLHLAVIANLEVCSAKKAAIFGKMYVQAWTTASDEMKVIIMKSCLRNIMERFLKSERRKLELNKVSNNMIGLLEVLHLERKKTNARFIDMITEAYEPILWKYLKSEQNVERCNAAEVFFKAFPLRKAEEVGGENELFFHEQCTRMSELLVDDCHIVRQIAIREVCNILPPYWSSFTPQQIQKLISIMIQQDAKDLSSYEVRRMVYTSLKNLLKTPESADYLMKILPNIKENIHDINKKVRISFLQLLLAIKNKNDPKLKFTDAVTIEHLCLTLAEENNEVGPWIMKLILSQFYQSNFDRNMWIKTFMFLIKKFPQSYRNFFYYSKSLLKLEDATRIMEGIMTVVGSHVLKKTTDDVEENKTGDQENDESLPKRKRKKDRRPLGNKNDTQDEESGESSKGESFFDDPKVVTPLLEIVYLLWIFFIDKLKEDVEAKTQVMMTVMSYAQPMINYYKDTGIFLTVIAVFSNIPANVLRQNSITLPGYCMNVLKKFTCAELADSKKREQFVTLINTLITWGKCSDVLDHVTLCLDSVFKSQDMNNTMATQKKRKKVQIVETYKSDPALAIEILDTIITTSQLKTKMLRKSREQLLDVWKLLANVQVLILTRITQGNNQVVSDEFLKKCFQLYMKLLPVLSSSYRNEDLTFDTDKIDHNTKLNDILNWFDITLWSYIDKQLIHHTQRDILVSIIRDFLYVTDNMITLCMVNGKQLIAVGRLLLKMLDSRYGHYIIESAARVACSINFMCKCVCDVNTDSGLWSRVIPSIVDHIISVIVNHSKENIVEEKTLLEVKKLFSKILLVYQENYLAGKETRIPFMLLNNICYPFVDGVVEIVKTSIAWDVDELPVYTKLNQIPPVASHLLQIFHSNRLLTQHFLYCVGRRLEQDRFYFSSIVTCVLLINFFAINEEKLQLNGYRKVLSKAEESLKRAYELRDNQMREERILSQKMRQTLHVQESSQEMTENTENASSQKTKSMWPSNAATFGDSQTASLPSSQADENVFNKGFDLIKHVRGALSTYTKK